MTRTKNKNRNRKARRAAAKSTSAGVDPNKKTLNDNKKSETPNESEQVVSDRKPIENEGKDGTTIESSSTADVSNKKPPGDHKPDQNSAQGKGKTSSEIQSVKGNKRKRSNERVEEGNSDRKGDANDANSRQGKEKRGMIIKENNEGEKKRDEKSGKEKKGTITNEKNEDGKKRDEKSGIEKTGMITNEKNEDGKKRDVKSGKEKKGTITNEKNEDEKKRDEKSGKNLGGLIFMCNTKTKPDCFHYHVLGISGSRKEFVMGIKPGLKLFLYDFDLKLLYGIYEAASAGGMKLEPAAFGGAFPAQVRFTVHKDCLPLPENIFKKAIKDNYDEKTHKFKTELTTSQVKHLSSLFQPVPQLHSNGKSLVRGLEPVPTPVPNVLPTAISHTEEKFKHHGSSKPVEDITRFDQEKKFSDHHVSSTHVPPQRPLFLTEQEYRNHGLQQGSHVLPTAVGGGTVNDQFQRNPDSTINNLIQQQREVKVGGTDTFFLSEKDYRTYGLRGPRDMPTEVSPRVRTSRAVEDESTTLLVNRYLSMPPNTVAASPPVGLHPPINYPNSTSGSSVHLGRIAPDGERSYSYTSYVPPRELSEYSQRPYLSRASHEPSEYSQRPYLSRASHEPSEFNQRPHSSLASHEPSEYNQRYHLLGSETNSSHATVSNRYSFLGPSFSRR